MPWTDWQFWVVTAVAAVGVRVLYRALRPRRRARRTELTIEGRPRGER